MAGGRYPAELIPSGCGPFGGRRNPRSRQGAGVFHFRWRVDRPFVRRHGRRPATTLVLRSVRLLYKKRATRCERACRGRRHRKTA
ncbi:hypothetical protein PA8380_62430 [Pseudomonas aeruginosa]|nr:hypothetical protein PA8380_62430 [Pseudomonas aeruginosa]